MKEAFIALFMIAVPLISILATIQIMKRKREKPILSFLWSDILSIFVASQEVKSWEMEDDQMVSLLTPFRGYSVNVPLKIGSIVLLGNKKEYYKIMVSNISRYHKEKYSIYEFDYKFINTGSEQNKSISYKVTL